MNCPNCGSEIPDGSLYCTQCGSKLSADTKRVCAQCGAPLEADHAFCTNCGAPVPAEDEAATASEASTSTEVEDESLATDGDTEVLTEHEKRLDADGKTETLTTEQLVSEGDAKTLSEQSERLGSEGEPYELTERMERVDINGETAILDEAFAVSDPSPQRAYPPIDPTKVMPSAPASSASATPPPAAAYASTGPAQPAPQAPSSMPASPPPAPAPSGGQKGGFPVLPVVIVIAATVVIVVALILFFVFGISNAPSTPPDDTVVSSEAVSESAQSTDADEETTPTITTTSVPYLVGMDLDQARRYLQDRGLVLGTVSDEYSNTTPVNQVISQIPSSGTLEKGSAVDLVVSLGPRPHEFTVMTGQTSWDDAESYCSSHGGQLASIDDAGEFDQIVSLLNNTSYTVAFVGGYRTSGGGWQWVNGTSFASSDYTYWAAGEPNNENGNERYLALLKSNGVWGWYDVPNYVGDVYPSDKIAFIMETN